VLPALDPGIVRSPPAGVDDDLVAGLDVGHVLTDRPHDAGAVAAAGVEVLGLAAALPLRDHVERIAERRPDVVVVDPRRHHVDENVLRADGRRGDDLALPRVARLTEAVLADEVRVHLLRHLAERRSLTEIVEIGHEFLLDDYPLNSLTTRGRRGSSIPAW